MSTTVMSIKTFKEVAVLLPEATSVLQRSNHGIGKSSCARQIRAMLADMDPELGEFPLIDRRAGQMSEGDVVGLPFTDGETTRFNPPDWVKKACVQPCFIHLDELNRGTIEVMQAFFQLVLDHELNGWKLHPKTRVFASINTDPMYTVTELDPALLDRFFVVDFEVDVAAWCEWARSKDPIHGGNLHFLIPDFISTNPQHLVSAKNADPGSREPSPRSWAQVDAALARAGLSESPEEGTFYQIVRGFVGNEAAIAFTAYCKNADIRITGEEVVEHMTDAKVLAKVKKATQDRQNDIIEKIADYVNKNCDKLNTVQGTNIRNFMRILPDELRIVLWGKLTVQGIEKIELCKSVRQWCAEDVLKVFGVPMGAAGIGVTPNIPSMFKTDKPTAT